MLKFDAKKEKALIETLKAIQEERAGLSRYKVVETAKSGLDLSGQFQTTPEGSHFIEIDLGGQRPQRVFLQNGVKPDKESYDLVIAEANNEFSFNGITYPKGSRKAMLV